MTGLQEIIDITSPRHGGNRLADRVVRAEIHHSTTGSTRWNHVSYETLPSRKGGKLIALPIISDELRHLAQRHTANQAA